MGNVTRNTSLAKATLPKATHSGVLRLGDILLDCYVLEGGRRVVSKRQITRALTGNDASNLVHYLGRSGLKPFLFKRIEVVHFELPERATDAHGLDADAVIAICKANAQALAAGALRTQRQVEIAAQCALIIVASASAGLVAMIDEATGYQAIRPPDDLSRYFHLILGETLRPYEKMFHERFWRALHRLARITGPWHQHPPYFAQIIREIIYDALAPGLADYLSENRPKSRSKRRWHMWLKEDTGVQMLKQHIESVTFLADACTSLSELRDRVKIAANVRNAQLILFLPAAGARKAA